MIAPLHATSESRPRLKSAGDPIKGGCFADGRRLDGPFGRHRPHRRDRTLESAHASECRDLASRVLPRGRSAVLKRKERGFKGAFTMNAAVMKRAVVGLNAHPNEVDRKRIECALGSRRRYRYVSPGVRPVKGGYLVESPCCSREIDKDGRVIEVALIHHDAVCGLWKLFWKDHARGIWQFHSVHQRLSAAIDELNADLDRVFWQ